MGKFPAIPGFQVAPYRRDMAALYCELDQVAEAGMLSFGGRRVRTACLFGFFGLLSGIDWFPVVDVLGRTWFFALGVSFALMTVPLANALESSTWLPVKINPSDMIWAALILSAAWPIAIFAFGESLMMITKIESPVIPNGTTGGAIAMSVGVIAASASLWAALRVLTKTWDVPIFCYLLLSGIVIVALLNPVQDFLDAHPMGSFRFLQDQDMFLFLLALPGCSLYGALFGVGLLRGGRDAKLST
jgi:hypothetical protein